MSNYDFKSLSPVDFEFLSRDLLQEDLNLRFESLKAGKDKGIDFRHCSSSNRTTIVQCKHYAESGFNALLRELKNETAKAKVLFPYRYILVTSVPLTVTNKETIFELYKSASVPLKIEDIVSQQDVNNLLVRYPKVHRAHFKLWISSTEVLERILHSATYNLSEDTLRRFSSTARVYVHNASFETAMSILESQNFCVIAGIPGIGKTTLAEMLALNFVKEGYEFIRITRDIEEALSLDYHSKRRIFYYDDFLGKTSLADKLSKNEDQRLIEFFRAIRRSGKSKLILTTREYILQQARSIYETIGSWSMDQVTCVVSMQHYTRRIRTEILFNHLYFSDLRPEIKAAIASSKELIRIIDHRNYNPRIVEHLADANRTGSKTPEEYLKHCVDVIENPSVIWDHAFNSQLTVACRNLLFVLATLPPEVRIEDLESAFWSFHRSMGDSFGFEIRPTDFSNALKESDGNFTKSERRGIYIAIEFHNPSAADYVQGQIVKQSAVCDLLLESCKFEEQLNWLWSFRYGTSKPFAFRDRLIHRAPVTKEALRRCLKEENCRLVLVSYAGGPRTVEVCQSSFESRLAFGLEVASSLGDKTYQEWEVNLDEAGRRTVDKSASPMYVLDLLKLLKKIDGLDRPLGIKYLNHAKSFLLSDLRFIEDFDVVTDFFDTFPHQVSKEERSEIRKRFELFISEPMSVISDDDDPQSINNTIELIQTVGGRLHVEIYQAESALEAHVAYLEGPDDDERYSGRNVDSDTHCSDRDISSIFDMLQT